MPVHPTFLVDPLMSDTEPVPGKTYRADGWAYVDMPPASPAVWEEVMTTLGEDVVVLAETRIKKDGVLHSIRGQFLLSPKGQEMAISKARKNRAS